ACARLWKTQEFPVVAGWLSINEEPFAIVREAVQRSRYFAPLVPKLPDNQGRGLLDVDPRGVAWLFPVLQGYRELAHALQIRVMLHLGEGRQDEAWQDLLTMHRLGRQVGSGG